MPHKEKRNISYVTAIEAILTQRITVSKPGISKYAQQLRDCKLIVSCKDVTIFSPINPA